MKIPVATDLRAVIINDTEYMAWVETDLRAVIINDTEYMAWVETDLRAVIVQNLARIIENRHL